jgi:hypothetical protein
VQKKNLLLCYNQRGQLQGHEMLSSEAGEPIYWNGSAFPHSGLLPRESYIVTDAKQGSRSLLARGSWLGNCSLGYSRKEHTWNYQNENCLFQKHGFKPSH